MGHNRFFVVDNIAYNFRIMVTVIFLCFSTTRRKLLLQTSLNTIKVLPCVFFTSKLTHVPFKHNCSGKTLMNFKKL